MDQELTELHKTLISYYILKLEDKSGWDEKESNKDT
jgi:hypothetical protein